MSAPLDSARLTLLLGATIPAPASPALLERLESVEVTTSDEGRSGFQLVFEAGRSGAEEMLDYPQVVDAQLAPFSRVVIMVFVGGTPHVLMDGVITNHQLQPGAEPGTSTFTVTGEDLSVLMDLEQKIVEHPAQSPEMTAAFILAQYASYGLVPVIVPSGQMPPLPTAKVPVQRATDYAYLTEKAQAVGYVFYVDTTAVPTVNQAYWGPPVRVGVPQRALSINMGPETNVSSVSFQYDALAPTRMSGKVKDPKLGSLPVTTLASTRPPLALMPALLMQSRVRTTLLNESKGESVTEAFVRAQGETEKSAESVVQAQGELEVSRYGAVLKARSIVGLRGAGFSYDGNYYVKSVTHHLKRGGFTQSFTLTREGTGALSPFVIT